MDETPTATMTPEAVKRGRDLFFVQAATLFGGVLLAAGLVDLVTRKRR